MTKRSQTRVQRFLCSVSAVGALLMGSVVPSAVSQTVTEPVSEEAAVFEGGNTADEVSDNDRGSAAESQAPDGPELGARNQANDVNAARFGDVIAIPKGTNAEGNLLYTLTSKVSATELGQDEYVRLVRQDSGAPVEVVQARFNSDEAEVSEGVDDQDRQVLSLPRPARVADSNVVEVDVEVDPSDAVTAHSWRLETSNEALDSEPSISPELFRSRQYAAADDPQADIWKIQEYKGGGNNFSLGKNPTFQLTEIVPEEDDGKVATIRFTFQVDGMGPQGGPFNELRFNPRGWFILEGAELEGLEYLWLNDSKDTNPENSLSAQQRGLRQLVEHSVDEKGAGAPLDVWSSTHFLISSNRPTIKNGDTLTVRYKLTRDGYEVEPDSGLSGTPTEHTYWVNTASQFTRYDISPDLKSIRIGRQFPAKLGYGDIAVTKDGKYLYAVQFVGRTTNSNGFVMDKYDARTGAHVGRGSFNLGASAAGSALTDGGQLNSLTFDYDGKLLFSTPKTTKGYSPIWKLDPSCVKDPALNSVCELGADIEELGLRWPNSGRKEVSSAGDFFVGSDGSLFGAGTTDSGFSRSESVIVRWPALEPGNPAAGRSNEGEIVGTLPRPTYGMGRFGEYILSTQTEGTHDSVANSGLVWSHFVSDGEGGYVLEGDELKATVESTPYGIFKPNQSLWGATSIYDSGPFNELILRIEKEVKGDRVQDDDQFQLGAFRDPSSLTNRRTYLEGAVTASTPETGLQDQVAFSYVKRGETYGIFEGFRNGEGKNLPKEHVEKYSSSLKCVEGNKWSASGTVVPTEALSELTANSDLESRLTIPSNPNLTAVTCRFSNSTAVDKTSLALFKMADKDGQNNLQLLDGAKFALHEKDEKAAGGLGTKVSDIVPNPESGYSVGDLEFDKPYLLVETQAPPGYLRISQPIEFMITRGQNGRSQLQLVSQPTSIGVALPPDDPNAQKVQNAGDVDGVALTVVNVEHPQLPKTGGPGVHRLGALGLMLLALGGVSLTNGGGRRRLPRMSW